MHTHCDVIQLQIPNYKTAQIFQCFNIFGASSTDGKKYRNRVKIDVGGIGELNLFWLVKVGTSEVSNKVSKKINA